MIGLDGEQLGLLIAVAIVLLALWGGIGRGSLARAMRDIFWPE